VADITVVRLPWQVGKIRNLAFGLMATSEGQLASGFRLPGDNTVNEQRAAFLVKSRRSADGENDEVKRLVGRIQPIWDRWAAMEGNNPPLQRSLAGRRDFDVNLDGVAHYGLLPDFLQDLKNVGLDTAALATLFRSAEDYIRMWETCDVRKGRI